MPPRSHLRLAALVAVLLALAIPATASAHARLVSTAPQSGARLDRAPGAVTLRFDEAVETAFGALRVLDANGKRVDDGHIVRPGGGSVVSVALRRELGSGTYTAAYRVISDEGHPVWGAFVFRVGAGGPAPAPTPPPPASSPGGAPGWGGRSSPGSARGAGPPPRGSPPSPAERRPRPPFARPPTSTARAATSPSRSGWGRCCSSSRAGC